MRREKWSGVRLIEFRYFLSPSCDTDWVLAGFVICLRQFTNHFSRNGNAESFAGAACFSPLFGPTMS